MSIYTILGIIVVLVIISIIFMYNNFIVLRTSVKEALSDIQIQFKRRYDLIPNLIETVKGYANFEQGTLQKVTEARNMAMNASGLKEEATAQNQLSGVLKSLFAVSEAYPDLKANQSFMDLQRELSETENKIQASRRFYNANIKAFTIATQKFPSSIIANLFGFKSDAFFELGEGEEAAKGPVKVDFKA